MYQIHEIISRSKQHVKDFDMHIHSVIARLDNPVALWIFSIIYRISLDVLYVYVVKGVSVHAKLILAPHPLKYVFSIFIYFLLFYLMPKKEKDFASFIMNFQFTITVAPMLSYYALSNQSNRYIIYVTICMLLQILIIRYKTTDTISYIQNIRPYATIFLCLIILISSIIPLLYNGFSGLKAFDLYFLNQIRSNMELPPVMPYVVAWTYSVIIPFFLVLSIDNKKYTYAALCILLQIYIYILIGLKFVYLILPVIIIVYIVAKYGVLLRAMYAGLALICILASVFWIFLGLSGPQNSIAYVVYYMFSVRFLFVPSLNKFEFYKFFSQSTFGFFSDGQIGRMFSFTYPYKAAFGQIIGSYTLGQALGDTNSSTGYLGEAYAQAGFVGMLTMSALFAYIVRILKKVEKGIAFAVLAAAFSSTIVRLTDTSLLTTLLSNGLIVLILIFYIYQKPKNIEVSGE